jgi:hypothetical protein
MDPPNRALHHDRPSIRTIIKEEEQEEGRRRSISLPVYPSKNPRGTPFYSLLSSGILDDYKGLATANG